MSHRRAHLLDKAASPGRGEMDDAVVFQRVELTGIDLEGASRSNSGNSRTRSVDFSEAAHRGTEAWLSATAFYLIFGGLVFAVACVALAAYALFLGAYQVVTLVGWVHLRDRDGTAVGAALIAVSVINVAAYATLLWSSLRKEYEPSPPEKVSRWVLALGVLVPTIAGAAFAAAGFLRGGAEAEGVRAAGLATQTLAALATGAFWVLQVRAYDHVYFQDSDVA